MKHSIGIILVLFLFVQTSIAQTTESKMQKEVVKNIEVTGVAELEVIPDELYFSISLKEYFKDEKKQTDKVGLEQLEKQLIEAVKSSGLAKENLSVSGVNGYKEWNGRRKPQYFLAGKQYQLKLNNTNDINELLSKVDDRGVEYASMSRVEHSKKEEFKKQVKINALKAAKDKATYLLESIGEKMDGVIEIKEVEDNNYYPQIAQRNFKMTMAAADAPESGGGAGLEFQKIKFSYRMLAIFKIK